MKREDNEQMRDTILDSVIACKKDASGAAVSLSQIACRAGISERTLNRYFPDKEMLLYSAAVKHLGVIYRSFADEYHVADKTGLNGMQKLMLLMRILVDRNRVDLSFGKVFVRAYTTALRTAVYNDLPAAGYDAPAREIVLDCVAEGSSDGSMRADLVPMDIYFLISSNYLGLVQRLIYFSSVNYSKEEHKKKLLLVFNKYIEMLGEYLGAGSINNDPVRK